MSLPTILVADDDRSIRTVLSQALGRAGYQVRATAQASTLWQWVEEGEGDLVITDVVMPDENGLDLIPRIRRIRPDLRVVVMSAQSTLMTAVKATQRGAFEYLPKPFDLKEVLAVVARALATPAMPVQAAVVAPRPEEQMSLIGRSVVMQDIYRIIARLTTSDLTVMITGESGTGKELVARALHDYGPRRAGPFVAINMAAIPRNLIESELFGHERGAFTGATSRVAGRFEQAAGGTLFLDEIGDMPPEAQTRLLRVLQDGAFTTVGGTVPIRANVRIIAATHRDLRQAIREGTFREDLYYRLNVVPMRLPPLRERVEDIPLLARHFLNENADDAGNVRVLDEEAMARLQAYRWPGNVRELENLMRRITALHPQESIGADIIDAELAEVSNTGVPGEGGSSTETLAEAVERHLRRFLAAGAGQDDMPMSDIYDKVIAEVERPLISMMLSATRGNQIRAAAMLGLNRNTLRKKIRDLDIPVVRGGGMTTPAPPRPSVAYRLARRMLDMLVRRNVALVLVLLALVLGVATFVVLSGGNSLAHHPQIQALVFILNFLVLLLLATSLTEKVGRVLAERRSGLAGARLHVRLVTLFGIVAVAPTIVVGTFAAVFFHYGIQIWFSDRVNTALNEALETSRGYLQEHNANIRTEAFSLANYLVSAQTALAGSGDDLLHNADALSQVLDSQATLRGLDVAVVYDPFTNTVVASGGLMGRAANMKDLPPPAATLMARTNEIAILDSADEKTVRAVVTLGDTPPLMLMIARPVDPDILEHMHRTEQVVADYQRLNGNRGKIQFTFVLIFALVAVLVLGAAILIGLMLANQIVRPLGLLILASERVSKGDLDSNVPEGDRDDEVASLSRAFNRMTTQLATQRAELIQANNQINERRRFTEAVLSGVSAGVIGLDSQRMIELPNRAASVLLHRDMADCVGRPLIEVVPELADMLARIAHDGARELTGEVQVLAGGRASTLLVRIGAEMQGSVAGVSAEGYVVTFDDITALQVAQRKAAWADVARRIAHEIKNPLTPIQLAAERLKRRFLREISSDPDTFVQCVDTIIRHVGDIGRMVDEFSAFARMPQPVMRNEDLSRIVREALILQRNAHPELVYDVDLPDRGPIVRCDRRLVGQALTNLLQNAADAIAMRAPGVAPGGDGVIGHIRITLENDGAHVRLRVEDDGIGLPVEDRARLTEPYVTHKPKGTGLGLAIVKKILEDHGGSIGLEDNAGGRGAVSTLILPIKDDHGA